MLSKREQEVIERIALGETNEMIAVHLGISPRTVGVHAGSILTKMHARNRTHAVMKWLVLMNAERPRENASG